MIYMSKSSGDRPQATGDRPKATEKNAGRPAF